MMKTSAALATALLAAVVTTHAAVVVTFDPPQLPHGSRGLSSYTESGVVFSGAAGNTSFSQTDTGLSGRPDDGTAHLDIVQNGTQFAFQDNSLFTLSQIDFAEYSTVYAVPATINLLGYKSDNTTVNFTFVTDGIIDGTGPLADFQTATLPATFTNLKYVAFNSSLFSIDNVRVNAVPEPSAYLGVLVLAGGGLLWRRRFVG